MVPTYPMGAEQDDAATPPQRTTAETMHTADLRTQVTLHLFKGPPPRCRVGTPRWTQAGLLASQPSKENL